jgi:hypothetical protein
MKRSQSVDWEKVEDMTLALMQLTSFKEKGGPLCTWKGYDQDVLNALHEKGWITYPATAAKSVALTEEGRKRSEDLFVRHFVRDRPGR